MIKETIQNPRSREDPGSSRSGRRPYAPGGPSRARVARSAPSTRTAVERASRGDVAAFSRLVETHSDFVRRIAVRLLGPDDAQDASQETWIRVWRNMEGFRGDSAFTTWLHRVATNVCLTMLRQKARRADRERGEEGTVLPTEPSRGEADPETSVLNGERREEVSAALERVRADHRAALVLRHIEGLSYAEISGALGVPVGTAKGWVSRGRDALLVGLSEGNGAPGAGQRPRSR